MALEAYRQALEIQSENGVLLLRCGEALLALGLASEALPYLESAAEAEPNSASVLATLGKALLDLARFAESRTVLSRALASSSEEQRRMQIHYQLARASQKIGDAEAAREHLREFSVLRSKLTASDK